MNYKIPKKKVKIQHQSKDDTSYIQDRCEEICKSMTNTECMGSVLSAKKISSGAFSTIYKVYFSNKGDVVLKVMDDVSREDYKRENLIVDSLSGKVTCKHYGGIMCEGVTFGASLKDDEHAGDVYVIVMEYLEHNFEYMVRKNIDSTLEKAVHLIDLLADYGLMNYDIKPGSFRSNYKNEMYMIDFTSAWVSTKVKTCMCLDDVVYPDKCNCLLGTVSKMYCKSIMKILLTLLSYSTYILPDRDDEAVEMGKKIVCTMIRKYLSKDETICKNLIADVFKFDEDLKTIIVHYLMTNRYETEQEKEDMIESDLVSRLWVELSYIISGCEFMKDKDIMDNIDDVINSI